MELWQIGIALIVGIAGASVIHFTGITEILDDSFHELMEKLMENEHRNFILLVLIVILAIILIASTWSIVSCYTSPSCYSWPLEEVPSVVIETPAIKFQLVN